MQYYVYGVNNMDSIWYLSKEGKDKCTLYAGADRRLRKAFDTKEEAQEAVEHLDYQFRFGSTRHYIQEALLSKPIGTHGFSCSCCGETLMPTDKVVVNSDTGEVICYDCATLSMFGL